MSRYRTSVFATTILATTLWALSCGEGTTEPPPDPPRPTTVTVTPAVAELTALGATVQLNAQVLDQYGQVMAGAAVTWSSGDASVAVVDGSGLVTAAGNGAATVTATAGSAAGTAAVTVVQTVSAVEVSPAAATVVERDTVRFEAVAMDANGHSVEAAEFTWASGDTSVAVVDGVGLVTGTGAGEVEVTATSSGVAGRAALVVEAPVPTTVTVAPDALEFTALGDTVRFMAEVRDQIGRVMEGEAVAWSSGDTMVAVVDSGGLVGAVGNGVVMVRATVGEASGEAVVTVMQKVSAVAVSPAADTVVERDTVRFEAAAMDANGHGVAAAEFAWSSSDTSVAVVDGVGLVSGVGLGQAEVTATAAGVTGRADLTVVAPAPTTIAVTPDTVALSALGETAQLAAEVRDQAGRVLTEADVSWSSGDTTVAEVDSLGLVAAVDVGETTITATSGEASGQAVVTVMQSAGSVVVSPAADTVALGDTLRLEAVAFDANGHVVADAAFTWSSSDAPVARVDGSGLVRGVGEGTATITATAGVAQGTAEITVANPDRAVLVALYHATDGPNWVNNDNWLTDAPLGEWYGVGTDGLGRVARVDLSGRWDSEARVYVPHGLTGPIPRELGSLANLIQLDLSNNQLTGPIPPDLGKLVNLRFLRLWYSDLTGPIPAELGNLSNLTSLSLGSNRLTGPIPAELGNLANLTWLDLPGNELSGEIPSELGNLASLIAMSLRWNDLSGQIPPELGNLANLSQLFLASNALWGPIPQSFLQLERLTLFSVGWNPGLCVPGSSVFIAWFGRVEEGIGPPVSRCNADDVAALKQLYETAGGAAWIESAGWTSDGAVEDWHGVTADSLGHVTELDLARNGLEGRLSSDLAALARMTVLRIGDNALTSRLPLSLARVPLREFHYANTELCAPAEASFQTWLDGIPSHEGTGIQCAPLSDRDILTLLYEATGGPDWVRNRNWLTGAPLEQWHGVFVDDEGHVVRLFSQNNNLAGSVPVELGSLANLTELNLGANQLTGPIPPELGNLASLTNLALYSNNLSGPIPPELGNLSSLRILLLSRNSVAGAIPPELGNLGSLTELALGGNALAGEIPAELGNLGSLEYLFLWGNDLTGKIPAELGNLGNVAYLSLSGNQLTGPIPARLGNLPNVTEFHLQGNALTGRIPGQLGRLSSVRRILLWGNNLTGPIPPELGNLSSAGILSFSDNNLSGPIPPELGNLGSVTYLGLDGNALSGSLPPELGNLTTLEELLLDDNDLEGPVPRGLGAMASLKELGLTGNAGMEGALPADMTDLHELDALLVGGTGLCAPSDLGFQTWLDGVFKRRIALCVAGNPPAAYLTQAVQSQAFPVPLVAGEKALLRVFPTARQATSVGIPAVRAHFYVNGRETHVVDIPDKATPIPTEVDESSLSKSANAEIPAQVIQPGLEMVIEVDPNGTLDEALGVATRIPETGRLAVNVRAMPLFDLTVIPFIWSETQDASIVDLVEAMAADPENHEMLGDTRTLLPIGDLVVTAHEPVVSSSNSAFSLLSQTVAIRAMEGGTGYYKGMMSPPVTGAGGVARLPGRSSFSLPQQSTLAHELGHNLYLYHAPCGGAGGPDPSFPYSDGSIGAWGYDFRGGGRLVHPVTPDLMSYCGPPDGISDYHFTNALRFRMSDADSVGLPDRAPPTQSLLLWGGVGADSVPFLEPSFVVDARPELPRFGGEYRLAGRTGGGEEIFSLSFPMPVVADGDGSSSFAFVLPVESGWAGALATITLSGPGGSVTLDADSDLSVTILRNPRTGQVRGILRDLPGPGAAAAFPAAPGLEVLFSRGIPDAAAWRR